MDNGPALRRLFPMRSTGIAMVFTAEQLAVDTSPEELPPGTEITYRASLDGNRRQRRTEASRRRRGA